VSVPPAALGVVGFWRAAGYARWFASDPLFDALVRLRLGRLRDRAAAGALDGWIASPQGALALIILLDQAPRNLFRGTPQAFATDALALTAAEEAIALGHDARVAAPMRSFFYLPFEHAEDLACQRRCVALFRALGDAEGLRYAEIHRDVVERFGRFPHRNAILGRPSLPEEERFLAEGGFAG
jgi:uncharacterized protein (DUF924 family)